MLFCMEAGIFPEEVQLGKRVNVYIFLVDGIKSPSIGRGRTISYSHMRAARSPQAHQQGMLLNFCI